MSPKNRTPEDKSPGQRLFCPKNYNFVSECRNAARKRMRAISTLRIRHMLRQACSLALAGIVLLAGCQRNEDRTLADELDRIIEQRQTFNDKKEERISELKRMLDVTGLSPRQEYDINARLCDQY